MDLTVHVIVGVYRQVDEDKGGSISPQELGSLMETLGLKPNQEELDAMIREIDEDGNGEIEFDEFVQVCCPPPAPCQNRTHTQPAALAKGGFTKTNLLGTCCHKK